VLAITKRKRLHNCIRLKAFTLFSLMW